MKHTILNLKKKVLVVEVPESATKWSIEFMPETEESDLESENILIFDSLDFISLGKSTAKFICKGSELTEEISSGIVGIKRISSGVGIIYQDYKNKDKWLYGKLSALDSFKSAIEANGFHWLENPIPEPNGENYYYEVKHSFNEVETLWDGGSYNEDLQQWQQAEEKTFINCLIFEILT